MGKKFVIGLTGNIATGKSIVRRMLQELGASTVDADAVVHALQRPGTSVYREIVDTFGSFILTETATINRKRLGDIVFNVPGALATLEGITHPAVRGQLLRAIDKAPSDVVVIEAIKLLESGLADHCDSVWVVTAPPETQLARMVQKRKVPMGVAKNRIQAQGSPQKKVDKADVVVDNGGDLLGTWNFVQKTYQALIAPPPPKAEDIQVKASDKKRLSVDKTKIEIRRAKRDDLGEMIALLSKGSQGHLLLDQAQMMERLFSKGYLVAHQGDSLVGMVGWQTENLIAGIDDLFVAGSSQWLSVGGTLMDEVERQARELSCEAGLVFLHNKTGPLAKRFLQKRGYEAKSPDEMVRDWRDAAQEWNSADTTMMVKQLLEKRVMTPL